MKKPSVQVESVLESCFLNNVTQGPKGCAVWKGTDTPKGEVQPTYVTHLCLLFVPGREMMTLGLSKGAFLVTPKLKF